MLIAWYKLEDNANDSTINNLDGTPASTNWISGVIGRGAEFVGSTSTITVPYNSLIDFGGDYGYSISFWVNFSAFSAARENVFIRDDWDYGLGISNSVIRVHNNNNGNIYYPDYNNSLSTNKWYHFTQVFRGYGTTEFYIDGVAQTIAVNNSTSGRPLSNGNLLFNGSFSNTIRFDDVRIYNHDLSLKEVQELSRAKLMHYKLDGNSFDSSGYDYHGTESNSTSYISGAIGELAYENDARATDRFISISNAPNVTKNQTLSMWLYPTSNAARHNPWNRAYGGEGTITHETNGTLNYYWGTNGGNSTPYQGFGSSFTLPLNQWSHVALVRDLDAGTLTWYLNGGESSNSTTASYAEAAVSTANVLIGNGYTTHYSGRIDDVRQYSHALSAAEVEEVYKQRVSIDNKGNLFARDIKETKHKTLLVNHTTWQDGQTGSVTGFSANGTAAENYRILGNDPWGKQTVLWEARPDATSGADGGWNGDYFSIDSSKLYRFSTWVNRTVTGNGRFYLGLNGAGGGGILNLSGTLNGNPYFWYTSGTPTATELPQNEWVLVVGHVFPSSHSGTSTHPDSGRYYQDGSIRGITSDFKWEAATTTARHRSYLYYATDTATRQQWVYPRVDVVDGTEPSISELLAGHDSRSIEQIRQKNGAAITFDIKNNQLTTGLFSEVGPTNGLVGWWPFNGNADDYANNNDGTATGVDIIEGYNSQKAYNFLDSGDVVTISPVGGYSTMTLCAWHKWDATSTSWRTVFAVSSGNIHHLIFNNAGYVAIFDGTTRNFNYYYPDTNWHHYCVIIESASTGYLYVDGVYQAQVNTTLDLTASPVGRIGNWSSNGYPVGGLQDVRIYNRGLSAAEIASLYNSSQPSAKQRMIESNTGFVYTKGQLKEY